MRDRGNRRMANIALQRVGNGGAVLEKQRAVGESEDLFFTAFWKALERNRQPPQNLHRNSCAERVATSNERIGPLTILQPSPASQFACCEAGDTVYD